TAGMAMEITLDLVGAQIDQVEAERGTDDGPAAGQQRKTVDAVPLAGGLEDVQEAAVVPDGHIEKIHGLEGKTAKVGREPAESLARRVAEVQIVDTEGPFQRCGSLHGAAAVGVAPGDRLAVQRPANPPD